MTDKDSTNSTGNDSNTDCNECYWLRSTMLTGSTILCAYKIFKPQLNTDSSLAATSIHAAKRGSSSLGMQRLYWTIATTSK